MADLPQWQLDRSDELLRGVGEALVRAALDIGRERGAQVAELQSGRGPSREAAHRLYERMGFRIRETDVFRISLE